MIGDYECPVISTNATSITCLTPLRPNTNAETDEITVFLKTSEEATCSMGGLGCNYVWSTSNIPALTSFATVFDSSSYTYEI